MNARQVALLTLISGIFLLDWVAPGQQPRRVDDAALRNAGKTGEEWLSYGLTPGETRYSPLKQIDTSNVSRWAGLVLRYRSGRRQPGSDSPDVERDALQHYQLEHRLCGGCAHRQRKVALGSGSEPAAVQPKICCGVVHRGVAIYEGNIIVPSSMAGWSRWMPKRASRCGNRASRIRKTTTP